MKRILTPGSRGTKTDSERMAELRKQLRALSERYPGHEEENQQLREKDESFREDLMQAENRVREAEQQRDDLGQRILSMITLLRQGKLTPGMDLDKMYDDITNTVQVLASQKQKKFLDMIHEQTKEKTAYVRSLEDRIFNMGNELDERQSGKTADEKIRRLLTINRQLKERNRALERNYDEMAAIVNTTKGESPDALQKALDTVKKLQDDLMRSDRQAFIADHLTEALAYRDKVREAEFSLHEESTAKHAGRGEVGGGEQEGAGVAERARSSQETPASR